VRTAPKNPAGELPSRPRTKKRQLHLIGYVGVRAAPTACIIFWSGRPIGKQAGRRDMQFLLMGTGRSMSVCWRCGIRSGLWNTWICPLDTRGELVSGVADN